MTDVLTEVIQEIATTRQAAETTFVASSRRRANRGPAPSSVAPAAPSRARQKQHANQAVTASAADPASRSTPTTVSAPGPQKSRRTRHHAIDTHSGAARAADQTVALALPVRAASGRPSSKRAGQHSSDTLSERAGTAGPAEPPGLPNSARQNANATQKAAASGGDDPGRQVSEPRTPTAEIVAAIVPLWRMRQRWHRAEKALVLQGKAYCRSIVPGGDKVKASAMFDAVAAGAESAPTEAILNLAPYLTAIDGFKAVRKAAEKDLVALARQLPVWPWVDSVHGFGALSLAAIVGEAGDPVGDYRSPAALWKRFGLAVIGGERQRKKSDKGEALLHGYSPRRRSVMWNVGGGIIGGMGKGPKRPFVGEPIDASLHPYPRLFLERLRYEAARDPEAHSRPPVPDKETGRLRESFSIIAAARAKRYVEKRVLLHLWQEWRRATTGADPSEPLPAANPSAPAAEQPAVVSTSPTKLAPAAPPSRRKAGPRRAELAASPIRRAPGEALSEAAE